MHKVSLTVIVSVFVAGALLQLMKSGMLSAPVKSAGEYISNGYKGA